MKTTRTALIIFFAVVFLLIVITTGIFLIFGIQSNPLITQDKKLTFEDVERVKRLMHDNNPRRLKPGDIKNATITERDLNLFLDYAFSQAVGNQKIYAHVNFNQSSLNTQFSYLLPNNPFGAYLNVSTVLAPESNRLTVQKLKIGALQIPGWLVSFVLGSANKLLKRYEQYKNAMELVDSIKEIQVADNSVSVVYQWSPDVIEKLRTQGQDFLIPADEKQRLLIYSERLSTISKSLNGRTVSMSLFLRELFQFAQQRTKAGSKAEAENRALLQNLAAFSVGRNINRFIDTANSKPLPGYGRVKLTLLGRDDLAKHFLVSAAITVSGGSGLANLAGIYKELNDSQSGSGFSFADLAADRAGVRFAEIASGSSEHAKLLQQRMSDNFKETDFMPRIDNLPEGIHEIEFKLKYKDLDSKTYKMVEGEIERRIAACRVYQF